MTKIKRKSENSNSKALIAVLAVFNSILFLALIALLILGLLFKGSDAPSIFSGRIYLMESDAFSLVKRGSAVVAKEVPYESITAGNIIIYTDDKNDIFVGEVQAFDFNEGVYTYTVKTDAGTALTVGQSHILGKGIYYSEFLGGIVNFVTSPGGVCLIALLPCVIFIIYDAIKAIRRKIPQPEVATVKKQDETPTYIPPVKPSVNLSDGRDFDEDLAFAPQKERKAEEAGLYTASARKSEYGSFGNYGSYDRSGRAVNSSPKPQNAVAVSEKDIDKLIREVKTERLKRLEGIAQADARQGAVSPKPSDKAPSQEHLTRFTSGSDRRPQPAESQNQPQYEPVPPERPTERPTEREEQPPVSPLNSKYAQESRSQYEEEINLTNQPAESRQKRPSPRLSPRVSKLDGLFRDEVQSNYNIDEILDRLGGGKN